MQDFWLFFQGIIGIFAAVGFYLFVRILLDAVIKRRSGLKMQVVILSCNEPEYAVRFAESRFVYGEYAGFFSGVTLSENVAISPECAARLHAEFPDFTNSAPLPEPTEAAKDCRKHGE